MVELLTPELSPIFHALSDATRRRMLLELSSGERTVPLPQIVANVLREWKLACPRTEDDFVFV